MLNNYEMSTRFLLRLSHDHNFRVIPVIAKRLYNVNVFYCFCCCWYSPSAIIPGYSLCALTQQIRKSSITPKSLGTCLCGNYLTLSVSCKASLPNVTRTPLVSNHDQRPGSRLCGRLGH